MSWSNLKDAGVPYARLHDVGGWMGANNRSIYGCTMAPEEFKVPVDSLLTYNPETKRLYVHLVNYPMGSLPFSFGDKVEYAQFLHDASEIKIRLTPKTHSDQSGVYNSADTFLLPTIKPDQEIPVIECFLK